MVGALAELRLVEKCIWVVTVCTRSQLVEGFVEAPSRLCGCGGVVGKQTHFWMNERFCLAWDVSYVWDALYPRCYCCIYVEGSAIRYCMVSFLRSQQQTLEFCNNNSKWTPHPNTPPPDSNKWSVTLYHAVNGVRHVQRHALLRPSVGKERKQTQTQTGRWGWTTRQRLQQQQYYVCRVISLLFRESPPHPHLHPPTPLL